MIGLAENGIEWFLYVGTGSVDEHECAGHIFHLFYGIFGCNYFIGEDGHESIGICNCVYEAFPVENLDRQGHVHDGLPFHDIGADLF